MQARKLAALLVPCLIALALSWARPASAQDADALKARGDESMETLKYQDALDFYTKAYALEPKPALLYNQGRALEALTRFPQALDKLEEFRRVAPDDLKARVPRLDELIEEIRSKISNLTITANVNGARVMVRKRGVGRTPIRESMRVNAGDAEIEIIAEGYHTFRKTVTLRGGEDHTVNAKLSLKSTIGVLVITSSVAGAQVRVDGKRAGTVPVEVQLEKGRHEIEVEADGYQDAETTAVVVAGERKRVRIALEKTKPLAQRWWFWTTIGAAVVAGGTVAWIYRPTESADKGDIPPGQVTGPFMRF